MSSLPSTAPTGGVSGSGTIGGDLASSLSLTTSGLRPTTLSLAVPLFSTGPAPDDVMPLPRLSSTRCRTPKAEGNENPSDPARGREGGRGAEDGDGART